MRANALRKRRPTCWRSIAIALKVRLTLTTNIGTYGDDFLL
jgi:hypothetical protein